MENHHNSAKKTKSTRNLEVTAIPAAIQKVPSAIMTSIGLDVTAKKVTSETITENAYRRTNAMNIQNVDETKNTMSAEAPAQKLATAGSKLESTVPNSAYQAASARRDLFETLSQATAFQSKFVHVYAIEMKST